MQNVDLQEIIKEIKAKGLTAYEMSKVLPLSEAGINKILNGISQPRKSTLLLLHNYLFGSSPTFEKQKTPQEDARFEDTITKKVLEELGPLLNERTEKILEAIMRLHIELNNIKIAQKESQKTLSSIEERV